MNGLTAAAARALRACTVVGLAGSLCCAAASVSAQAASAPSAALRNVNLGDVACPSAKMCMTLGSDITGDHARPFAEIWNGSAWTVTHPREPANATASYLYSVSCPAVRACVAVGDYDTNADPNGRPYAQKWNGHKWTITAVLPEPRNDSFSGLSAVSCASARSCVATGQAIRGGHNNTYTAVFNGHAWRLVPADLPRGTTYSRLASVSCTGPRACTAAGEYQLHETAKSRTLIETFNGQAWTHHATPNPRSGPNGSEFDSVSCATPRACVAVGHRTSLANDGSLTFAERLTGQRWKRTAVRDQTAASSSVLSDVACPSRRRCVAVGISFSDGPPPSSATLTETFNGTSWRTVATPVPAGAVAVSLDSVACSAPGACMAIGSYYDSDPSVMTTPPSIPVAFTFNGTAWTLAAAP